MNVKIAMINLYNNLLQEIKGKRGGTKQVNGILSMFVILWFIAIIMLLFIKCPLILFMIINGTLLVHYNKDNIKEIQDE